MAKQIIAKSDYIPIIGTNWAWPIVVIWQELKGLPARRPNEVQTGALENGHSVAIVAMASFMVESYLSRMKYILRERNELEDTFAKSTPIELFRRIVTDSGLADDLEELFVARDAVVHNHVWDSVICWTDDGMEFVGTPEHVRQLSGDKKFDKVIDRGKRATRRLELNLFPNRVGREDTKKCMRVACEALLQLEKMDRSFCYISHWPVRLNDKIVLLVDFMRNPDTCGEEPDHLPMAELDGDQG